MRYTGVWLFIWLLMSPVIQAAEQCRSITLHYAVRPPYVVEHNGQVIGLTATIAEQAFIAEGIKFRWQATPFKRQWKLIEDNQGCDCGLGWFKTADREQIARYTLPIYRDNPQVVLAKANNTAIQPGITVPELLNNRRLVLQVKVGYSYGPWLDQQIRQLQPTIDATSGESELMLQKLYAERADYFFIAPEEATALIARSGYAANDFKQISMANMPPGEFRYIPCSLKVPTEVIERLNAQISQLGLE